MNVKSLNGPIKLLYWYPFSTHASRVNKMAAAVVDGKNLGSVLPPGSELSCTTTQGDTLRGNVVATDDQTKVVVISILLYTDQWQHSMAIQCTISTGIQFVALQLLGNKRTMLVVSIKHLRLLLVLIPEFLLPNLLVLHENWGLNGLGSELNLFHCGVRCVNWQKKSLEQSILFWGYFLAFVTCMRKNGGEGQNNTKVQEEYSTSASYFPWPLHTRRWQVLRNQRACD